MVTMNKLAPWLICLGLLFGMGLAGSAEATPIPPEGRYDYQPVNVKDVKKHVKKVIRYDRNICITWKYEKPRKRFVRDYADRLVSLGNWGPYPVVKKGIRKGFRDACN